MRSLRSIPAVIPVVVMFVSMASAKDLEMTIDTVPSGARVERNGNTIGTTPLRRMYPKTYFDAPNTIWSKYLGESVVLTFHKDGYYAKTVELTHGPFLWRSFNGANTFLYYLLERNYLVTLEKLDIEPPSISPSKPGKVSYGTAFHVFVRGYLVTNFHVVDGAATITVSRKGARCPATLRANDKANDLAILQVDVACVDTLQLKEPLHLGASASMVAGADVTTYGYPLPQEFGAEPQVSKGIIKSLTGLEADARTLTISNTLQPGNSGGPLFTDDGEIVGVVTATMNVNYLYPRYNALPQDLNFALKSEYVSLLFEVSGIAGEEVKAQTVSPPKATPTVAQGGRTSPPTSSLELVERNLVLVTTESVE